MITKVKKRWHVINALIKRFGLESYLEIGVERGDTFFRLRGLSRKTAVDPVMDDAVRERWEKDDRKAMVAFLRMDSEDYFSRIL